MENMSHTLESHRYFLCQIYILKILQDTMYLVYGTALLNYILEARNLSYKPAKQCLQGSSYCEETVDKATESHTLCIVSICSDIGLA